MYGNKIFTTGLFLFLAAPGLIPAAAIVGSVFMAIGVVLVWLDK